MRVLQVYKIECTVQGTLIGTYIGCGNAANEYKAKKYQPPPKMRAAIAAYKPYEHYFTLTVLESCSSVSHMRAREAATIAAYNATGPRGFNTLSGHPPNSAKYHFLKDAGLLKNCKKPHWRA